ncbi:hypothetical protein G6F22_016289 [Rhizopus arrhizus]|nr:hypothetical protein G6F22_016289 [Rhizopus arrhizus]
MAKIKLTKTAVEAAQPQPQAVELRDTVVPGFLCKITPAGRRVFMLQYRTNAGERRKPALGLFGELTVEQARVMAQDWLAEVRRGGDPGGAKADARKAPTHAARLSGRHRPLHHPDHGADEGAGREAPGRGRADEEAGPQAGRGQPHLRRAAQDVQPGRSVGAASGRHKPVPPRPDVSARQGNPAHRGR